MATGHNVSFTTKLRYSVKNKERTRVSELSERKVDCIVPGCKEKSKTYRVLTKHFLKEHSTNSVLGIGCNIPSCEWFCSKSLKCFTEHMKIHGVTVGPTTEMILRRCRVYVSGHSAICNTMKSDTIANNLEKLKVAKEIVKNTKKVNKDNLTNNNNQQNPEIQFEVEVSNNPEVTNEVEVSDNRLDSSEALDVGVESLIVALRTDENAENVNIQQKVNSPSVSTKESGSDSEYNSEDDTTNYWDSEEEEEEVVEAFILPKNLAFKREFDEITLSSDEEDDAVPVEEVKSKKRKLNVKKVLSF
jgi:hypothetical protein